MSGADTAKRLGVTVAGLRILAIAIGDRHGRATGPAFGIATQGPRLELRRDGMLRGMDFILGDSLFSESGEDGGIVAGALVSTSARQCFIL